MSNLVKLSAFGVSELEHYYLMNKNKIVLEFLEIPYGNSTTLTIVPSSISLAYPWLPEINRFVESRTMISNRKTIEFLLSNLGVTSRFDIVKATYGVSLVDTLWVKNVNDKRNWESVSPYSKDHSFDISWFFDKTSSIQEKLQIERPEYSTDGNFPKCWITEHGEHFLIKCGSQGASNTELESFSELYTNQIEQVLGLAPISVKYNLECVDYASFGAESEYRQSYGLQENVREYIPSTCRIASKCKCFTTEELGLVTAAQLHLTSYKSVLDFAENIRPKCREKIASQLLLDCLTVNTDRHFGNIGFLYHNDSFDIVDVAPIYDNNLALLPGWLSFFPESVMEYAERLVAADGSDFIKLGCCVLEELPAMREKVQKIAECFELKSKGELNFKRERLEDLGRVVRYQARKILQG